MFWYFCQIFGLLWFYPFKSIIIFCPRTPTFCWIISFYTSLGAFWQNFIKSYLFCHIRSWINISYVKPMKNSEEFSFSPNFSSLISQKRDQQPINFFRSNYFFFSFLTKNNIYLKSYLFSNWPANILKF